MIGLNRPFQDGHRYLRRTLESPEKNQALLHIKIPLIVRTENILLHVYIFFFTNGMMCVSYCNIAMMIMCTSVREPFCEGEKTRTAPKAQMVSLYTPTFDVFNSRSHKKVKYERKFKQI